MNAGKEGLKFVYTMDYNVPSYLCGDEGIIRKNPYKCLHIKKDKNSEAALEKYLTKEEFARLANMQLPTDYLRHARDLFLFQTFTCMAYVDLAAFDPATAKREVVGPLACNGKFGDHISRGAVGTDGCLYFAEAGNTPTKLFKCDLGFAAGTPEKKHRMWG